MEAEIGHLLLIKEQQEKAIGNLRRAVELDAEHAAAWRDLGLALIMAGDPAEAEKALGQVPGTRSFVGDGLVQPRTSAHARRAIWSRRRPDLIKAAELAPENQDVARLLQQVAAGKMKVHDLKIRQRLAPISLMIIRSFLIDCWRLSLWVRILSRTVS